jgi:transposase InsO family protein
VLHSSILGTRSPSVQRGFGSSVNPRTINRRRWWNCQEGIFSLEPASTRELAHDPAGTATNSAAAERPRSSIKPALDFMTETLYDGRRVRLLTIIDEGNREALEIEMGMSLLSRRIVRILNELVALHGRPSAVRVDNGPEFTAQPFVEWCAEHGVATRYIQPGQPDQNAYIQHLSAITPIEAFGTRTSLNSSRSCALTARFARAPDTERVCCPTSGRTGRDRSRMF